MPAFIFVIISFFRTIRAALRDTEYRGLILFVALIIGAGTLFYRFAENWRWLDAFYFSVVTLTTIGYGDLSPQTDFGKVFTVFYILLGLGAFTAFITAVAQKQRERLGKHDRS